LVAVDVGHFHGEPGVISASGIPEFEFNLQLAREVKQDLEKLDFQVRSDLMQTFKQQITTMPEQYAADVARSYSSGVGTIITEETSKLMLSGQSPEDTAKNIEDRGNQFIQENPDVEARS